EILAEARISLQEKFNQLSEAQKTAALRQIYIVEGSDWFWWYGDDRSFFDILFRKHLTNFYKIIGQNTPEYLSHPL
ncbi:MAG: glycoside hydrolase, partial [Candidatus Omnitrophota bacterium]